jgi:DNA-binding NarL/FixJ family response regulator
VLQGQLVLNPPIADRLLRRSKERSAEPMHGRLPVSRLSDRELEVFELLGHGLTSAEVASRLGIRQKTVETFREKIKRKLELSNSNQLIQHAVQWVLERQ